MITVCRETLSLSLNTGKGDLVDGLNCPVSNPNGAADTVGLSACDDKSITVVTGDDGLEICLL